MHPQDPQNPEYGQSTHDKKQNDMDTFNHKLWANREILGEKSQSQILNFPYKNLKQFKTLPDKILVHLKKAPNGSVLLIKNINGTLNYICLDDNGNQ